LLTKAGPREVVIAALLAAGTIRRGRDEALWVVSRLIQSTAKIFLAIGYWLFSALQD
jgi:hypothetical protein